MIALNNNLEEPNCMVISLFHKKLMMFIIEIFPLEKDISIEMGINIIEWKTLNVVIFAWVKILRLCHHGVSGSCNFRLLD